MRITVFGGGGWGTALCAILSRKHEAVSLYVRNPSLQAVIASTRENKTYLPGIFLPSNVTVTNNIAEALAGSDLVLLTVPSHVIGQSAAAMRGALPSHAVMVSCAKGLEEGTCLRLSEVISRELPEVGRRVAVLSGPNHAEEVGRMIPSASVVACGQHDVAEWVQDALITNEFRVYTNSDIAGVEYAGAFKNVIALGIGIAEGLGFGDNSKAAFMTRGLVEITRLGVAAGAHAPTFSGLAGVGDLIATCTSRHSRNRRAGIEIARGRKIADILAEGGMVIEGVRAAAAAKFLAERLSVEMPITSAIHAVLHAGKDPRDAVVELMSRTRTHEMEEVALPFQDSSQ